MRYLLLILLYFFVVYTPIYAQRGYKQRIKSSEELKRGYKQRIKSSEELIRLAKNQGVEAYLTSNAQALLGVSLQGKKITGIVLEVDYATSQGDCCIFLRKNSAHEWKLSKFILNDQDLNFSPKNYDTFESDLFEGLKNDMIKGEFLGIPFSNLKKTAQKMYYEYQNDNLYVVTKNLQQNDKYHDWLITEVNSWDQLSSQFYPIQYSLNQQDIDEFNKKFNGVEFDIIPGSTSTSVRVQKETHQVVTEIKPEEPNDALPFPADEKPLDVLTHNDVVILDTTVNSKPISVKGETQKDSINAVVATPVNSTEGKPLVDDNVVVNAPVCKSKTKEKSTPVDIAVTPVNFDEKQSKKVRWFNKIFQHSLGSSKK